MKVVLLAGGTGAAKLAVGLQAALPRGDLTVIANTADDRAFWGLHVSPDVDSVLFRLAGLFNEESGFGIAGDSFETLAMMRRLGEPAWFALGDRDLAFHILRSKLLAQGARLTEASLELARRLQLASRVIPMSDDPVRTWFETERGAMEFQEYYVRQRAEPRVTAVSYAGLEVAAPAPEAVAAVREAGLVVIGPSNPVVSVWPILHLLGPRMVPERTLAVSPTVGGQALKGPTVEMMRGLGRDPSATGVAREYAGLAGTFVLDQTDAAEASAIEALGYAVRLEDTVMRSARDAERLARALIRLD
ncbi:MAG TPA: 2-phospho-L-lactate transferase [Candidatus Dormibacteraeota bacterium]